jgi:NADPH:quinone reductase-like Zn-dependent oxidoreductase
LGRETPWSRTDSDARSYRSGYTVVTACGPENFDYVKHLGADLALDYRKPDVGAQIRSYTRNQLKYAWDTVGVDDSARICAEALSSTERGLKYGNIVPVQSPRDDVETTSTVMYTVFGKAFKFGDIEFPAIPDDLEFGKKFYSITESLLEKVSTINRSILHSNLARDMC